MREETHDPLESEATGNTEVGDDPFAGEHVAGPVAEDLVLDADPNISGRLDPARIAAERWTALIVLTVILLPASGAAIWVWGFSSWTLAWSWAVSAAAVALFIGVAIHSYHWPVLEHRFTQWRLDDEGLEIRRGVVWRHVISVPRRRIQHTDVSQGPIQRRFGLGTLIVHTAGTHSYEIRLEGLSHQVALWARDSLIKQRTPQDKLRPKDGVVCGDQIIDQ